MPAVGAVRSFFTHDRSFYKKFFTMAIVLMLQNMVTISVNLADNIMLGAYSETALAGAAAVNQIQFVYQQILFAFGDGIVVLAGQYFGKRQMDPVRRIIAFAMRLGLFAAVALFIAATAMPHLLLEFFTTDEGIIGQGMLYLDVLRYTFVFFAVTQILLAALRCVGIVKIALLLSVVTLILNCSINYTLIYGHFGAPELGVTGAAIGTLISRIVEMGICIFFIVRWESTLKLRFRDFLQTSKTLTRDYIRVMSPMLVINFLWGFNNAAQNAILGHMEARAIAANSVASTLFLLVKSMAVGAASTAAYFISHTVGAGRIDLAKEYARTMQVLFIAIGVVAGITLYNLRVPILSLYNLEDATRLMADQFLIVLSVIVATMSYQMPANAGIVKGGGDTKYCMYLDLISIWCIVLPVSWFMAFVVNADPVTVIWCLNADQIFKGIPAFIKVNFGHWAKKLTRDA